MDSVEIEVEGTDAVVMSLASLNRNLRGRADEAVQEFALRVEARTVENITAGGIPLVPLAPVTLAEKARLGYTLTPLVRTGEMRQRVRSEKTGEMEAQIAVADPKAVYHELGAPSAGIPERPFLRPAVRQELPSLMEDVQKLKEVEP